MHESRFGATDEELTGFFTSAVGLKGQSYEASGGHAFDAHRAAELRLHAMRWMTRAVGVREWFDRVRATLGAVPHAQRRVLELVYTPHSWPATWMASELMPPWGGGSMAALALTLPDVEPAFRRWLFDADRPELAEWKRRRATCARLVARGDELRVEAITAYDAVRSARVKAEAAAEPERRAVRAERRDAYERRQCGIVASERAIARRMGGAR